MKNQFYLVVRAAVLALLVSFAVSAHAVSFTAGSATVAPNVNATIPITTSGFSQVLTFQFTVQWDASVLQYVSSASSGVAGINFGTGSVSSGKLTVSWDDPAGLGQNYSDGITAFTIEFKAVGANGTSSSVSFSNNPVAREALVNVNNNLVTQVPGTSDGSVNVSKPKPTVTWSNPAAITYGTALGSGQLNAVAYVPGTTTVLAGSFAYVPASGTVLGAGTQTLSVSFTPNDTAAYDNNTASVSLTVNKATPVLAWSNPADIGYGTPLSGVQLNATASIGGSTVAGTLVYAPAAGTILSIGNSQALAVTFNPTDSANFNSATAGATINVTKGNQTIAFGALGNKTFGDAAFTVAGTASSELPVAFSIASGPATISGNTVTITGAGTVTVRASQAGNDNYNAAANVDQSFTVAKASQLITFGALSGKSFGDAPFAVGATASSGLPVSFSIVSGPATISGGMVTLTGVGTVIVRASQAGNDNYDAASGVEQSFSVAKGGQTISFGTLGLKYFGDAPFAINATASSGLPVSFSIVSGPATISGSTITLTGIGTVMVRASQAGDANYNAAANVDQSFAVAKGSQTISFGALGNKAYGDAAFALSATASSGLGVSFSVVSGPATMSGGSVTITGVGIVVIRASQAGNENYEAAANVDQSFTVSKGNQAISFGSYGNKTFGDGPFTVSATASSGLPVSFSIASGPASISGNTVTITGAGTVTIRASQSGNEYYNAASAVDQTFGVARANQTISFDAINDKTVGDPAFALSAVASSGLPVSFSIVSGAATVAGNNVIVGGGGLVTVRAVQEGNGNYNPAPPVERSFSVNKTGQTISFGSLTGKTYGDPAFTVSASASSGLPVSFSIVSGPATVSGSTVTISGAGTVTVRAAQPGNESYNPAPSVDQSFIVSKGNQTITFNAINNRAYTDGPFSLSASSSSGLEIEYSIVTGPVSISEGIVNVTGVGTVTVRASQGGNGNYNPAASVEQSFLVSRGSQTISFSSLSNRVFGEGAFTVNASASSGLAVSFSIVSGPASVIGNRVTVTGVGNVTVRASQGGSDNYNPAPDVNQSFTVGKAGQSITFGVLSDRSIGDTFTISALSGSGLPVVFTVLSGPATISGSTMTTTGAGRVVVRASQSGNENYEAAPSVEQSFSVNKSGQSITFDTVAAKTFGDAPFTLTATASSGLGVVFSVVSGNASVSGNVLTLTGAGSVTIRATQSGNENFDPAPTVERTFLVGKSNQTVSFAPLPQKIGLSAPFAVNATASSGLPVSISVASGPGTIAGNLVTITGAGTVTLRASQAGDANYNAAASLDLPITVGKENQSIVFEVPSGKKYGDRPFQLAANASSGLPVSFSIVSGPATISEKTVTILGAGIVIIRASQAGNANFNSAPNVEKAITVSKADQSITFDDLADRILGDPAFALAASSSSKLLVEFSVISGPAVIAGSTITLTGVGNVIVQAFQRGDVNFNAAVPVERTFAVGTPKNERPTISQIANQTIQENSSSSVLVFRVADNETPLSKLIVSGASSNEKLIPPGGIRLEGEGANRTVTIIPAPGQTGTALITLTVRDGGEGISNTSFEVSVVAVPPAITKQPEDQSVARNGTALFEVVAEGSQPMLYQWLRNGTPISGATNSQFAVTKTLPADEGIYSAEVRNRAGAVMSRDARLTIVELPRIIVQPENKAVLVGGNVTFVVTAAGSGPVGYQWRFNGNALTGETNPSLVLNRVSALDAGEYSVEVSGAGGVIVSSIAVLKVIEPAAIAKHPETQSSAVGGKVAFSVEVTGTPPFRFQWQQNGVDLPGEISSTLNISSVTPSDAGEYSVVVVNAGGAVSSSLARLTVTVPPLIIRQPQGQTVPVRGLVAFAVTVSGSEPLSYQWRFNGVDLPGATGRVLERSDVTSANEGVYSVVITNPSGAISSADAVLKVSVPVRITRQPSSQTVISGRDAIFSVAAEGSAPLSYQWRVNGVDIPRAINSSLTVPNATAADSGTYHVLIANAAGPVLSAPAVLRVESPPAILEDPQDQIVMEGSGVEFRVTAIGTGPLEYQWQKNGVDILGATTAALRLTAARTSDAGSYRVVVRNSAGVATSGLAVLKVLNPPVIQVQPVGRNAAVGQTVAFSVQASGEPPLAIQWKKNGINIAGATDPVLSLNNVQAADAGSYSVLVQNGGGVVGSDEAVLTLILPPFRSSASAQTAPPPIEAAEGSFDGGSNDSGIGQQGRRSVPAGTERWFSWKAPSSGVAVFTTAGSTFDTIMTIYSGSPGNLTELGSDDDSGGFFGSRISFNATQGSTYLINVKGFGGAVGRIVVSFKLAITNQRVPRILVQPASGTFRAKSDVTFSVQAEGSNLSYQWFANGVPISGATLSTLTLKSVERRDVAKYTVRISSGSGPSLQAVDSLAASLQLSTENALAQDKFKKAPRLAGVLPLGADSASLMNPLADGILRAYSGSIAMSTVLSTTEQGEPRHCDVTGGASEWLTYLAPANGVLRISTAGSDFDSVAAVYSGSGADFETLKLEACDNNGAPGGTNAVVNVNVRAGTVYFVAVDGMNGASGTAIVSYELGQGPLITRHPESLSVALGGSATFSVETTNTLSSVSGNVPVLSYQWMKDGVRLNGETNQVLTIANSRVSHSGDYAVVVSNFAGTATSVVSRLLVNVPVTITSHPSSQVVRAGSQVALSVTASGTAPMTFQWLRNGAEISHATNAVYEIMDAQLDQSGEYTVVARNGAGSVSSIPGLLTVIQSPVITVPPASQVASVGQRVTMKVTASGSAPLTYQWRFNGVNISGAIGAVFELGTVQASDEGEYTVVVSNSADSILSPPAQLKVGIPLIFTSVPQNQAVTAGSSVVFSVGALGTGTLRYQWKFNGGVISGANGRNLTILDAQPANAGAYTVVVSDATGSIESLPATLVVGEVPEAAALSDVRYNAGTFSFRVVIPVGKRGVIETSLDLRVWERLIVDPLASGSLNIEDPRAGAFEFRFYRVVLESLP